MLSLLLCTSVLSPAPPASATETSSDEAEASGVEDIAFALVGEWPELDPETLEPVLASNLVDLGIEIHVSSRPAQNVFVQLDWARSLGAQRRGRAVFWLVRLDAETVQLFVIPPGTDLGYVRDIPSAAGSDELAEQLAVIVRGAAESLRAGAPSGMRSVDAGPEPEPEPEPEPDSESDADPESSPEPDLDAGDPSAEQVVHVRLGLTYLGATLAASAPWQSGAGLELGLRLRSRLALGLSAGWVTSEARDETSPLRVQRVPLSFALGYAFDPKRVVSGRVLAVGTGEWIGWQPRSGSAPSLRGGRDLRVGLGVRGDLVLHVHAGLAVLVGASATAWLRNVRVDVEASGEPRSVLAPWPAGGELRVGLEYEF
ncbi:hypothetical protein G6O69_17565 [Pseudenhygromyxa sp. WMMC2535]|uniref:hypothetical protein n=1 Tax=Pseudenhygromyxa sp. WMMC2535 TaxID=2712867 RepID=UPI001557FF11|nr:hypothetical protein [Pseudenhygromyxa sp. WMMC2535]NVB39655.1 hypothetical protein [Pseudenhygromyxa sp. WMMC2535]